MHSFLIIISYYRKIKLNVMQNKIQIPKSHVTIQNKTLQSSII